MAKTATHNQTAAEKSLRALVAEAAQEVLHDPDFGLELSVDAKKRLTRARSFRGKTVSLADIKKKHF